MYLTIHLILFAGAFVAFAWQFCTGRPRSRKYRSPWRQRSSLLSATRASRGVSVRDFHQPIEKPKSEARTLRRRSGSSLGDAYRPVNRIHHFWP